MPTPAFPIRLMDMKQVLNRAFEEVPGDPDGRGRLRVVSTSAVTSTRDEETAQAVGSDLSFESATETTPYNVVFIGVARTGGSEDFEVDVSVKRGSVLHPIYKRTTFKSFVSITDNLKLTANETIQITTTGITASTVDITVIKEY